MNPPLVDDKNYHVVTILSHRVDVQFNKVVIAHHDTVIETDDHVILFMTDRRKIERLEQLFQVSVSFV